MLLLVLLDIAEKCFYIQISTSSIPLETVAGCDGVLEEELEDEDVLDEASFAEDVAPSLDDEAEGPFTRELTVELFLSVMTVTGVLSVLITD